MIAMPVTSHAVVFAALSMYLWAAGRSSWQTMKTIIPPTIEKMMRTSCVKTGCRAAYPNMPPMGSVRPDRNDRGRRAAGAGRVVDRHRPEPLGDVVHGDSDTERRAELGVLQRYQEGGETLGEVVHSDRERGDHPFASAPPRSGRRSGRP